MSISVATRRDFVKTVAVGLAGAAVGMPASSYARILGSNERIGIGIIGMGRQARGHLQRLLQDHAATAQVVALSDVYEPNLRWAAQRVPDAQTYTDFRRLLERPEVDAVFVVTPDHWHALNTILATEAGKDVYVEKPTAVRVSEGRQMVEAARKNNRIVQVGTQQRSSFVFQNAVDIVRSGKLGPISFVRTWNYGNEYPAGIGNPPDGAPPAGLDWEMWLGPAPRVPYNANRFGVAVDAEGNFTRWATWRYFWDYAGGMMTDWGVHLLDIVQWAMEVDYPTSVAAVGGKFYLQDNRDTPDTIVATYQYPTFVATYENRQDNGFPMEGHGYGIMFHGTNGTLFVDRSVLKLMPEKGSSLEPLELKNEGNDGSKHIANFLDSVKSREKPICDIEIGHRSSSTAMLGNVAYRLGRQIQWDGEREVAVDLPEAEALLISEYRTPWAL